MCGRFSRRCDGSGGTRYRREEGDIGLFAERMAPAESAVGRQLRKQSVGDGADVVLLLASIRDHHLLARCGGCIGVTLRLDGKVMCSRGE